MLKFWNTSYPFNDFVVISFKKDSVLPIEKVKHLLKDNGIKHQNETSIGCQQIILASAFPGVCVEGVYLVFSGVAQCDGRFIFGQKEITETEISNLRNSVGLFTFAMIKKGELLLTQDFVGMGTLFYSDMGGAFIVSNRYHLLLLVLACMGYKGKLLQSKVISTIYSYTTFLAQNVSSKMDIEGTYQLPFHQEIIINKRGAEIIDKTEVLNAFKGRMTVGERHELFLQGKREIIDNIESVMVSKFFKKVVLDLSGGQDSRAVLSALLNIENGINMVELFTKNNPGSKDLEIASGLKNLLGGRYYREDGRPQYPVTLKESLNIWRSYYMGTYFYSLGLGAWSPRGENQKQIRLSGGCGEIYKGNWYPIYRNAIENIDDASALVNQLVNSFPSVFNNNLEYRQILKDLLIEEINNIPGKNALDKLENQYIYFLNRYHFGMKAFEYYHDCPIWFPLMSKSMFTLAMSIPVDERLNQNLLLELIEQLHPLLVWIDFEKLGRIYKPNLDRSMLSDIRFKGLNIKLDTSTDEWYKIQEINNNILLKNRPQMNQEFYQDWRLSKEKIYEDLLNAFNELNSYYPQIFGDQLLNYIKINHQSNVRFLYQMYAKLYSLKDQVDIFRQTF